MNDIIMNIQKQETTCVYFRLGIKEELFWKQWWTCVFQRG